MYNTLSLRKLQTECARASVILPYEKIEFLSSKTQYSSVQYYKLVVDIYIKEFGGLPSETGPGKDVKLLYEN
jgi:hypothetical protein